MSNPIILFKLTSRSRPSLAFRALDSIVKNLHDKENYKIICTFDYSDTTMNNAEVMMRLNQYKNLRYFFGGDGTKIEAINKDIDKFPERWDILVNFSDDQVITSLFFDRFIRQAFAQNFPDFDGVVHFPDQKTGAALITMSIMGRKYFDRFGFIYAPEYISLHSDNEFTEIARLLGKYVFVDIPIYKHLHPMWKLAPMDAQYARTESYYKHDGLTFKKRKLKNFYLDQYDWYKPLRILKLSILICSVWDRLPFLGKLIDTFEQQLGTRLSVDQIQFEGYEIIKFIYPDVEIVCCIDNRKFSIGTKRNILLDTAQGKYEAFFDDDDMPTPHYIQEVMTGINKNVDCCSLIGVITTDNAFPKIFRHYLSCEKYDEVNGEFLRFPNHLNCIKTNIARKFKFPEINFSEDTDWATQLKNSKVLKTEHQVSQAIYHYKYLTNK